MRRGLVLSLLVSTTLLFGSPALAQDATAPGPAPEIITSFDPDGEPCTGVPDAVPGVFDFTAACTQHDACYAAAGDRLACDLAFRQAMIAACQAQFPSAFDPRRYTCLSFAELYFVGVRLVGGFSFPTP
ncbi:MAG: phospholipase [Actinomycetota bacterium]|nr:phospholipase [Actinomycetota bacterium]